jgi:CubicO group peptidase (beta-lactamase class C family)
LLVALALTPARAQGTGVLPADQVARIETAITTFMSRRGVPALSVAVATGDRVVWQRGYGFADLENFVPGKSSTVYRIASVTKALTAVAAMQLVEQGRLDLDAPVQKYAPTFPVKPFPITTRQLLTHTSGIRNYRPAEGERTNRYASLTDALDIFKDDPLEFEPGTRYGYTTYGYTLLGVVIEGASGMSFPDYLHERVLIPSGMTHTYVDDIFALIPNRAHGYHPKTYAQFNGEVRNPSLMDSSYKVSAGGLVSTAEDIVRFGVAVQNGVLVKRETFALMSEVQKTRDGRETGYGYGWYVGTREGRPRSVWHGGVQQGFTGDLWLLPDKHFTIAILTNLEGGEILGLSGLANQVADVVLTKP